MLLFTEDKKAYADTSNKLFKTCVTYFCIPNINTSVLKVFRTPVSGQGGPYGPNTRNILFKTNFALKFGSLVKYTKKQTNKQTNVAKKSKIKEKVCPLDHLSVKSTFHQIRLTCVSAQLIARYRSNVRIFRFSTQIINLSKN